MDKFFIFNYYKNYKKKKKKKDIIKINKVFIIKT